MSAATHTRIRITLLVSAALYHGTGAAQPDADEFTPYRAVYELFDGDKRVGRSVFSLRYDPAADRYEFETRSEFRGLLRLLAPRPIVERSLFTVVDDSIRPLEFSYRDGTWRGRRNADLRFDWDTGTVLTHADDASHELSLRAGTLDQGSVRVALMRDLARAKTAGTYLIADVDEISAYEYRNEAIETVSTAVGELATYRVSQQRQGSTRHTLLWAAPELHYLPVRIEQRREGRSPVAFVLESVEWIDAPARPSP